MLGIDSVRSLVGEHCFNDAVTLIQKARRTKSVDGMLPSVYVVKLPCGQYCAGSNYQPKSTLIGQTFLYDHGTDQTLNNDAFVVWVKTEA